MLFCNVWSILLIFVIQKLPFLDITSDSGADSEIYTAKEGDSIKLNCTDTKNVSNAYNYYYYGFIMFVDQNFSSIKMQIWPRTYYYNSEYYYSSGRFNFSSDSSSLALSIENLQFGDAGAYWCQYNSLDVSTHIVIVNGKALDYSMFSWTCIWSNKVLLQ